MAGVLRCARTSPHTLPSSEWYTIVHSEAAEAVHAHDNCDGGKLQLQQLSTPSGYGGGLTKYPWALGEKSGLLPVVPSPPLLFFAVAPGLRPSPSYHPCISPPRPPLRRFTPRRCTTRTSCLVPRCHSSVQVRPPAQSVGYEYRPRRRVSCGTRSASVSYGSSMVESEVESRPSSYTAVCRGCSTISHSDGSVMGWV